MVEKYKVITKGSRWNYDLNFDGVKSLEEVRRTLQSIIDDLPHPEIDPHCAYQDINQSYGDCNIQRYDSVAGHTPRNSCRDE